MSATRKPKPAAGRNGGSGLLPTILLAAALMAIALQVVVVKNDHRRQAGRAHALLDQREQLELEWAQLQLEQATLAQAARIEPMARAQFALVDPAAWQTIEIEQGRQRAADPDPIPAAAATEDDR